MLGKIFNLNNELDFDKAEKYKSLLENKGLKVIVTNHGLNGVKINGVFIK